MGSLLLSFAAAALLGGAPADSVPLYRDLGNHTHKISTTVPLAQQYFDQGLRLVYAFNHAEAIRAFREAARLDSTCAICWWGVALAYGPHVNAGMDSASGAQAWDALQQARALAPKASPAERAYIEALAARYASPPPADRARLDSAYARAMTALARRNPKDLDAVTLAAEARMDLRPWNYWKADGTPYPGTAELVADLERVIRADPSHPGACHYYIHAVEAVRPALAVPCAERLAGLMPGAGHIVHMPAHIYIRVGRYDDAIASNVHAVHTDENFIAEEHPSGVYPAAYYPHNLHFLAFAATLAGRSDQAIEAARALSAKTSLEVARQVPMVEAMVAYLPLTLVTFGRWEEVLRTPLPPGDLRVATAMAQYSRGVALAATGRGAEAAAALDTVKSIAAKATGDVKPTLDIAARALSGELAFRAGRLPEAEAHFKAAMAIEDGLLYMEPPHWYYPIRHSLGAVYLREGRAVEAERLYRQDLQRFPENGWALFGLAKALQAQGRTHDAAQVEARFRRAWHASDVQLASSRF
jgi:tetratricopeptide (TPR) repeat protein